MRDCEVDLLAIKLQATAVDEHEGAIVKRQWRFEDATIGRQETK